VTGPGLRSVDRGQPFTVELPAAGAAGYRWQVASLPAGVQLVGTEYRVKPGSGVGGSGTQVLRFTAAEPGLHRIELVYQRPWESEAAELQSVDVRVR